MTRLPDFDRLWDYGNPQKSEQAFRELLPQARASGDASYLAQLLTQVARAQGLQRKFEEAHRTLDEAEGLLRDDLKLARVRYCLERGRAFNSAGAPEKARPLFLQAWETASAAGIEDHAADAAHMMGIIEPPEAALEWNRRVIALAEKSANPRVRGWLGPVHNNMGWTLFERKDYREALAAFEKSRDAFAERKLVKETRIARWSIAKALRMLERVPEALKLQEEIRTEWEAASDPDGYNYEELGECLLALGRAQEAKPQFARAYELLSTDEWLVKNEASRLARLKKLGF